MHGIPDQRVRWRLQIVRVVLLMAVCGLPVLAQAETGWEVDEALMAPDASWDVDEAVLEPDPSWDVAPSEAEAMGGHGASRLRAEDEVGAEDPADVSWRAADDESSSDGWSDPDDEISSEGWSDTGEGLEAGTLRASYRDVSASAFGHKRFVLRLTPMLGYREPISLSFAWTQQDYFEVEVGVFLDPFHRRDGGMVESPDGGDAQRVRARAMAYGFYGRAAITYPLFDYRGSRQRAWQGDVLIPLELRVPVVAGQFAVLLGIHMGAEFTRWLNARHGVVFGATIGAPIWDFRSGSSLQFRPIVRGHIGLAF